MTLNRLFKNQWIKRDQTRKALQLGLSSTIENLLALRFEDAFDIKNFLEPSLREVSLPDEEVAVKRIIEALSNSERITVLGDYDVDGMSSTALLKLFFKEFEAEVNYIIPSRYRHGYGLNPRSIALIGETDLLITVDCGISSLSEVEELKSRMDIIITDHHEPGERLPEALAVVNPKLKEDNYPSLAGVGVVFRLVEALSRAMNRPLKDDYWVLAMLGTISDVMPLLDDNRMIVKEGLKKLPSTGLPGLSALMKELKLNPYTLESQDVAFKIGPALNSTGRLGEEHLGLSLLTTEDSLEAPSLARDLVALNNKRKALQSDLLRQAQGRLNHSDAFHVVAGEGWLEGMLGIVASKLVETTRKPCILLNKSETYKGSGRSIGHFNMLESLHQAQHTLLRYGGHQAACGVEVHPESLEEFRDILNSYAREHLREEDKLQELYYHPLTLQDISMKRLDEIELLKPFGTGNEEPLFGLEGLRLQRVDLLGKHQSTYLLHFTKDDRRMDVISFSPPEINLLPGESYDILFTLNKNVFNGILRLQLQLKDIRYSTTRVDRYSPCIDDELERYVGMLSSDEVAQVGYLTIEGAFEEGASYDELCRKLPRLMDSREYLMGHGALERFINHLPTRDDLVLIYKHLLKTEGTLEADETKMSFLKLLLSLKILEEIEILSYTRNRFSFLVNLVNPDKKFDLMDSIIYSNALKLKEEFNELKK